METKRKLILIGLLLIGVILISGYVETPSKPTSPVGSSIGVIDGWVFQILNENKTEFVFVNSGMICLDLKEGNEHLCYSEMDKKNITSNFMVNQIFPTNLSVLSKEEIINKIENLSESGILLCKINKVGTPIIFYNPGRGPDHWEIPVDCQKVDMLAIFDPLGNLMEIHPGNFSQLISNIFYEEEARKIVKDYLEANNIYKDLGKGYCVIYSKGQGGGLHWGEGPISKESMGKKEPLH
jgi:hypothetical protein